MSRCAVVEYASNIVVNMIICSPSDEPPESCFLVDVDQHPEVDIGWIYDPSTGTFDPPPETQTEEDQA